MSNNTAPTTDKEVNTRFTAAMCFNSDKTVIQALRTEMGLGEKEGMRAILTLVNRHKPELLEIGAEMKAAEIKAAEELKATRLAAKEQEKAAAAAKKAQEKAEAAAKAAAEAAAKVAPAAEPVSTPAPAATKGTSTKKGSKGNKAAPAVTVTVGTESDSKDEVVHVAGTEVTV